MQNTRKHRFLSMFSLILTGGGFVFAILLGLFSDSARFFVLVDQTRREVAPLRSNAAKNELLRQANAFLGAADNAIPTSGFFSTGESVDSCRERLLQTRIGRERMVIAGLKNLPLDWTQNELARFKIDSPIPEEWDAVLTSSVQATVQATKQSAGLSGTSNCGDSASVADGGHFGRLVPSPWRTFETSSGLSAQTNLTVSNVEGQNEADQTNLAASNSQETIRLLQEWAGTEEDSELESAILFLNQVETSLGDDSEPSLVFEASATSGTELDFHDSCPLNRLASFSSSEIQAVHSLEYQMARVAMPFSFLLSFFSAFCSFGFGFSNLPLVQILTDSKDLVTLFLQQTRNVRHFLCEVKKCFFSLNEFKRGCLNRGIRWSLIREIASFSSSAHRETSTTHLLF